MAKQHRMFVLTLGCIAGAIERAAAGTIWALYAALTIVVVGAALTAMRRISRLAAEISAR
jgi:hypothetical protein